MRWALISLLAASVAHADTSTSLPAPRGLREFMSRVRAVAAAHDVRALAKLVDREFTVGEELPRSSSLASLRSDPQVLDELVTVIDSGHCDIEPSRAQCEAHIAGSAPERRTIVIFLRERHRWRLGVFAPSLD